MLSGPEHVAYGTDWFGVRQVGILLMDQREGNDVVKATAEAETWEEGFDSRAEKPGKTSRSGSVTRGLTGREHLLSLNIRTPLLSKQWALKVDRLILYFEIISNYGEF